MNEYKLTAEQIAAYGHYLCLEERAPGTQEKYLRDVRAFARWLDGRPVTRETAAGWKEHLLAARLAPVTVNSMLAAINSLFSFLAWDGLRVKYLKVQRRLFRDQSRELSQEEYRRLLAAARELGRERLALLMETMGATGIRVSEVRYITVEAAQAGQAEIFLKGKVRVILIPGKLRRKLLHYAKTQKIASGEIFLTGSGKSLGRRQIWAEMKRLCKHAGVDAKKIFPHNLRHLFATAFYRVCKDVVRLSDVLGHSSIETTRIYLLTTGEEHLRQMDRLGMVV